MWTLNSPNWQASIGLAVKVYGSRIRTGAGTVINTDAVAALNGLGCQFMLMPNTDTAVIAAARAHGIEVCAGCLTASAAFTALGAGASSLKIFPASEVGPGCIRALHAVLPCGTAIYAVDGITTDNLAHYLHAGCTGIGSGSDRYRAGQSVVQTREKAQTFMACWQATQL